MRLIPCAYPMPESWGPSLQELVDAAVLEHTASYDVVEEEDDGDYAGYGEGEEDEDDAELLEIAEESALRDAYRQDERSTTEKLGLDDRDDLSSSPVKSRSSSPRKRSRFD